MGSGPPLPAGGVDRLRAVMEALRAPHSGCPWDRDQSLRTLQPYLIEECYELLDAIDGLGAGADANAAAIEALAGARSEAVAAWREELGDVLLQVVFQAHVASEARHFDLDDVAQGIADKMIRRHPHVFGDEQVADAAAVVERWHAIKRAEGRGTLDGVPRALPALLRAQRIGAKAARVAFDWPDAAGALAKVDEELAELRSALAASAGAATVEAELGDALFALASVARHLEVDAEGALRRTLDRFVRRFARVESAIAGLPDERRRDPTTLDAAWEAAKRAEALEGTEGEA